jgi:rhamnose transport system substrate-binding protein
MKNQRVFTRLAITLLLLLSAISSFGASGHALAQSADCAAGAAGASPEASPTGGGGASPAAGAGVNMAFVPKDIVNNYFANSFKGAQEAASETGGQVQQVGPDTPDAAGQVQFIQTLTQQGVQAIGVSANDPNALAPALKDARAKGIKVVSYDSDVAPDARTVFVNQASSEDIGRVEVQTLAKQINSEGEIAILSAASTATNQNTWIDFMKDELSKPAYSKMKLVKVAYGNDDDAKSLTEAQGLIQAYPNLKGIISPTTVGIAAAARAVQSAGKKGKIAVTGLGTPNQMREYVKDGTVTEFLLWDVQKLGYLAYQTAAAVIQGKITGKPGESFEAGSLGKYTIGENSVVLLGKPTAFNKDNIDQFDF